MKVEYAKYIPHIGNEHEFAEMLINAIREGNSFVSRIFCFSLLIFFSVISLIPNFAIQVRRLRDAAKKPLWLIIS